jgi:hypothetical protein
MYFATHAQCKSIALPDLCTLLLVKEVVVHNFFHLWMCITNVCSMDDDVFILFILDRSIACLASITKDFYTDIDGLLFSIL